MITTSVPHLRSCLVDTNILLRITQSPEIAPAHHAAIHRLKRSGCKLYTTFQNIAEYWNASTRPEDKNGFGLSFEQVRENVSWLEGQFEIITEDRNTYERWLLLLVDFNVSGRQVHDARLVAHMLEQDIPVLLTSNIKDFTRYPHIQLIDPEHWT